MIKNRIHVAIDEEFIIDYGGVTESFTTLPANLVFKNSAHRKYEYILEPGKTHSINLDIFTNLKVLGIFSGENCPMQVLDDAGDVICHTNLNQLVLNVFSNTDNINPVPDKLNVFLDNLEDTVKLVIIMVGEI